MNEGALLTVAASGVLSNDVAGADGFTAGGGVVGVRAAGGDPTTDVTTGVNTSIAGLHGTLILQANGSYTYQSTANNITANTTDVFVYTVKDGDGDLSTTTLTINLADATLVAPADNDVTVNEAALDTTITGSDLAAGTVTGSLGHQPAETDATNQLNGSGGFGTLTYALVSGGNAATAGTFGTIQVNTRRQLYLHADHAVRHRRRTPTTAPTPRQAESFTYMVTDANGNTATGTITVNIVDDVPTATLDSGNVNEGALLTVAASGVLSNDVAGADGFTAGGGVVGVRAAGGDPTTAVTTGVNTSIAGLHGTLILQANGSYTYQSTANNITANTTDVFVYTIKDGDGDLSTTTLTINLADSDAHCAGRQRRDGQRGGARHDDHRLRPCGRDGDGQPRHRQSRRRPMRPTSSTRSGGIGALTYALVTGGNAATAGTFGTIQVNAERQLHLHADQRRSTPRRTPTTAPTRRTSGELHLHGDRRQRQHRDRHDHGQHRRRRADGDVGQRQCERRRAADGCGVRGAVERRCRRRWLYGRRRGCRGSRGGRRPDDGCDDRASTPALRGCTARSFCRRTAATPTSRRRTTSRRTPPTCLSTRSRTATATCRRRR